MGRKTRILRRPNKFGLKYASHLRLRENKEEKEVIFLLTEEIPRTIIEEILEPEIEPVIEEKVEVKKPIPFKKTAKPKK